ncbi:MAG: hypothetical protein VKJ46_15255 [Leptolyngbyaceae bacterium]|nr:hypothetical protein [Leptolyngbyaceae bacterium]
MAILEVILIIGTIAFAGNIILNAVRDTQQQRQLDDAFYRLIERQDGCVSLIQLAAYARVEAQWASSYLEQQAKAFEASVEVDAEGNSFYRFPKLHLSREQPSR